MEKINDIFFYEVVEKKIAKELLKETIKNYPISSFNEHWPLSQAKIFSPAGANILLFFFLNKS